MGVLSDWQIARDVVIEGAQEGIKREGKISYGYTSYGYDARIGYVFDVFSPIHATEIDPKNFDRKALQRVDLTPVQCEECDGKGQFRLQPDGVEKVFKCSVCKGTGSSTPRYIRIPPHSFVLGESVETFTIPRDVLCIVVGKSTYARCGLIVNVTPGEPEWRGKWTIEISNTSDLPARVYCGEGIMQCIFLRTDGKAEATTEALKRFLSPYPGSLNQTAGIEFRDALDKANCTVSYLDKKGKYQDQTGLTLPTVDQK